MNKTTWTKVYVETIFSRVCYNTRVYGVKIGRILIPILIFYETDPLQKTHGSWFNVLVLEQILHVSYLMF